MGRRGGVWRLAVDEMEPKSLSSRSRTLKDDFSDTDSIPRSTSHHKLVRRRDIVQP